MLLTPLQGMALGAFGGLLALMALGFFGRRRLSLTLLLASFLVGESLSLVSQFNENRINAGAIRRTATSLWQDAVNKSPQKLRTRVNLAYSYQVNREFDVALAEYRNAGFLSFKDESESDSARGARSRIATAIGQILIGLGDYGQAGGILSNAWNQDQGFPGLGANLSFVLIHDNRPDLALLVLERTIADAPSYVWFRDIGTLYFNQGRAFAMLGRCDEAEASFVAAQNIEPDFAAFPRQPVCKQN